MNAITIVLGQRNLRLLLSAGLASVIGDWIMRVGLTYYVYAVTGSTLASAFMLFFSFLPQIVLGSFAGVFVDRWDLRWTMVVADVLLAAGLVPLLAVHHPGQIWIVYAVTAWEGCVQQFFFPAQQGILTRIADKEHWMTVNSLANQNGDLSRLVGSAVGGFLAAAGGIGLLTILDAASFLASALLIIGMGAVPGDSRAAGPRGPAGAAEPRPARPSPWRRVAGLGAEWVEGLRLSTRGRVLRVILACVLITCVGEGVMGTLFAPFVRSVLHGSVSAYGVISAVQAAGGIAGGLLTAAAGPRLNPARALGAGAVAFGVIDLAVFLYPLALRALWPAIVLMVIVGVPGALLNAGAMTLIQQHAEPGSLGRIFGAVSAVEGVAMVAGIWAAGLLGGWVGIVPVLVTQGAAYVIAGAVVLALLGRRGAAAAGSPPLSVEDPAWTP